MRHRHNKIHMLGLVNGPICNKEELKQHIWGHFRRIFGETKKWRIRLSSRSWPPVEGMETLEMPFMKDEIKRVVWDQCTLKSPGPDSFLFCSIMCSATRQGVTY